MPQPRTVFGTFARIQFQTLVHYLFPPRWKTYFPFVSLCSIAVALLVLEYHGFRKLFNFIRQIHDFPLFFIQFLLERLFALIFLISYSMLFMSSIINGLSTFFLSANLPFLKTLPIPRWKILFLKFVENWFVSCYLVVSFLFCFLLAHAHSFEAGWKQYFASILLLLVFTLSPVAVGSSVVTILIRFFPVRKIHQLVTVLAGMFLTLLLVAVRLMQPERLLNPTGTDDFIRLMKDLTLPSLSHLPSSWAAHTIIYGSLSTALWLTLFSGISIVLLIFVLRQFHERAFLQSQESRTLHRKPTPRQQFGSPKKRSKIQGLVIKDLKLFLRDATQWSQLLLLGGLVIIYLLNIQNLAIQLPMVRWLVSFINLGLAGFVLAALSVRFLFPSVSMEGRSFWIIRTVPVSFRTLLWCKYLIYFPPFLVFTQLLVYFSNRILNVPPFFVQLSMANILAIAFALTGLAIGIGALMPNFKADHPSKIAVGPGGVLYMLLSFSYIACMLLIQLRPVWFHVIERSDPIHNTVYVFGALLLTLLVALVPMEWGARQLARKEYV